MARGTAGAFITRRRWTDKRLWLALIIWVGSALAGAAFVIINPHLLVRAIGKSIPAPPWIQQAVRYDPPVGTVQPLPRLYDLQGRTRVLPEQGRPTCLLFVWRCNTCGVAEKIRHLEAVSTQLPGVKTWVVVVRGQSKAVKEFWKENNLTLPVALDRDGEVARQLNAVFLARTYLFDSAGKLQYVSPYGAGLERIEHRLHEFARTGR